MRGKFDPCSKHLFFIGVCNGSFYLWNPETQKVEFVQNFEFNETKLFKNSKKEEVCKQNMVRDNRGCNKNCMVKGDMLESDVKII